MEFQSASRSLSLEPERKRGSLARIDHHDTFTVSGPRYMPERSAKDIEVASSFSDLVMGNNRPHWLYRLVAGIRNTEEELTLFLSRGAIFYSRLKHVMPYSAILSSYSEPTRGGRTVFANDVLFSSRAYGFRVRSPQGVDVHAWIRVNLKLGPHSEKEWDNLWSAVSVHPGTLKRESESWTLEGMLVDMLRKATARHGGLEDKEAKRKAGALLACLSRNVSSTND
jgi:hypothetical protein